MTEPFYADATVTLHHGDCLDVLRELPDCSVDAVVTDPPYGLGFMGKEWDSGKAFVERKAAKSNTFDHVGGNHNPSNSADAARTRRVESRKFGEWCELWATECLRVLKPGGHMLAFGGTRTWHRLTCAVEDAGFEIRDSIAWMYGSGFPKSMDVSKAIDKAAGADPTVVGLSPDSAARTARSFPTDDPVVGGYTKHAEGDRVITAPVTDDARTWHGWGTALKPGYEPILVARKPLAGTVVANVLAHGTGALNIDATRIEHASDADRAESVNKNRHADFGTEPGQNEVYGDYSTTPVRNYDGAKGRWPANVVLDESQADALDVMSGNLAAGNHPAHRSGDRKDSVYELGHTGTDGEARATEIGGASRFFYTAKAGADERVRVNRVAHPTVKPLALMRWLVRLVTPPGGLVLDPFAGSGTTAEACLLEGFQCIAIEREPTYLPLIVQRLNRRRDPVAAVAATDEDHGLFGLLGENT